MIFTATEALETICFAVIQAGSDDVTALEAPHPIQ